MDNLDKAIEIYRKCDRKSPEKCDTCPLRLRHGYGIPLCALLEAVDTEFKEA